MNKDSKIYIAGHQGFVGKAVMNELLRTGYKNIVVRNRRELDLCSANKVARFIYDEQPNVIINCAGMVGGIGYNKENQAGMLLRNVVIQQNLIKAYEDWAHEINKQLFVNLASSCMYPKNCKQPMKETDILSGQFEETNEGYALAKVVGMKLCEYLIKDYITVVPTNLYGEGDHFDENAHVIPMLIKKFHEAREKGEEFVEVWGTGKARREFMYITDFAKVLVKIMRDYNKKETINIGVGQDYDIACIAQIVKDITGYQGEIRFNPNKPEGVKQKLLDISKQNKIIDLDFIPIHYGIKKTYDYFLEFIA